MVRFVVLGDLDGDGLFDHEDPDKDNDGVCNKEEAVEGVCTAGPDAFPEEKSQWADSDGDGVGDNLDGCDVYFEADETPTEDCSGDMFPDDPNEWFDADLDGVGDNSDDDDDNDGLTDAEEVATYNTDPYRKDTDGDTLSDYEEILLWHGIFGADNPIPDSDEDGLPNHLDKDSDGDGWIDGQEDDDGLLDPDGDGLENIRDPDSDNDGLKDGYDLAPYFKANTDTTGNGGGGSPGNMGGSSNVGSEGACDPNAGPLPPSCDPWRIAHPLKFNQMEHEVVSGNMEGTTEIIDWDCCAGFCDCYEDETIRSESCRDTVSSALYNNSQKQTTLKQFNWQMESIDYSCDHITEESDGLLPYSSWFSYNSPGNVSAIHDTQYKIPDTIITSSDIWLTVITMAPL